MVAKKTSHEYSLYHNYKRHDNHSQQETYNIVRKTGLRNSRKTKCSKKDTSPELKESCKEDETISKGKIKRMTDKFKGSSPHGNEKCVLESSNVILDSSWGNMSPSTRNPLKSNGTASASKNHQHGSSGTRTRKSTTSKSSKLPRKIKQSKNSEKPSDSKPDGQSKPSKIQPSISNMRKKASLWNNNDNSIERNMTRSRRKVASSDKIKPVERHTESKIATVSKQNKVTSQSRRVTWNLNEIKMFECGDNVGDETKPSRSKFSSLSQFLHRSDSTESSRSYGSDSFTTQTNDEDDKFDLVKEIFMCTQNTCVRL